jgi:uncharacterized protein YceH (UPF0502 family)
MDLEAPQWRPLSAVDRRVLGVLVEKAKTTPTAYPMTLNAICVGANQKSNRDPEMNLQPERAQDALDRLRQLGAVGEVQGEGRVAKFRHYGYKWLGVDKVEMAVMTELLLRGAQTVGELRGRAARMEPIADLAALRPILHSLIEKKLVVSLTPEGRGQVVSHTLYEKSELDRLRGQYHGVSGGGGDDADEPAASAGSPNVPRSAPAAGSSASASGSSVPAPGSTSSHGVASNPLGGGSVAPALAKIASLETEVAALRAEVAELRRAVEEFRTLVT